MDKDEEEALRCQAEGMRHEALVKSYVSLHILLEHQTQSLEFTRAVTLRAMRQRGDEHRKDLEAYEIKLEEQEASLQRTLRHEVMANQECGQAKAALKAAREDLTAAKDNLKALDDAYLVLMGRLAARHTAEAYNEVLSAFRTTVFDRYKDGPPIAAIPSKEETARFKPLPPDVVKTNGGQRCDMWDGPCSCGAWHKGGK